MSYYYCTRHDYKVGDTLTPGNFKKFITKQNLYGQLLEVHFESVRKLQMPAAIGRLDCLFAFTDLKDVEGFTAGTDKKIYELRPHDLKLISHHNYRIFSYFLGQLATKPMFPHDEQLFEKYWLGDDTTVYEDCFGQELTYIQEAHIGCPAEIINIM